MADEQLFAYLDDLYVVCAPERVVEIYKLFAQALEEHAQIQIHLGMTQVESWGSFSSPVRCIADSPCPNARVGRRQGSSEEQGIRVLGIPIGHTDFVKAQLRATTVTHKTLFERIWCVQDLQSAWLLLLFCANTRAMCSLRGVPPVEAAQFAAAHDDATWDFCVKLLGLPRSTQDVARLPFHFGGCGLRSATRSSVPAHWASWADSPRMIHRRHPGVADTMIRCFSEPNGLRHFTAASGC